jgi:hypothetical protein
MDLLQYHQLRLLAICVLCFPSRKNIYIYMYLASVIRHANRLITRSCAAS